MQTKNKVWRGWSLGLLAVAVLFLLLFSLAQDASAAKKKKYDTWKAVAADMAIEFSRARENVEKGEYKAAHKNMNDAYFGYYEIQGFEKNVMVAISSARVNHIEASSRPSSTCCSAQRFDGQSDARQRDRRPESEGLQGRHGPGR